MFGFTWTGRCERTIGRTGRPVNCLFICWQQTRFSIKNLKTECRRRRPCSVQRDAAFHRRLPRRRHLAAVGEFTRSRTTPNVLFIYALPRRTDAVTYVLRMSRVALYSVCTVCSKVVAVDSSVCFLVWPRSSRLQVTRRYTNVSV